jgi:hypothetical protein
MKSVLLKVAKWGGIAFALLLLLTVIMQLVDPEGMKKAREENSARAEKRKESAAKGEESTDRIFKHGFTTGFTLAKGGAVKPSSDQVDAMARQAANALKESGGLGFKMAWKDAFWMGWNKGD